MASLYDFTFDQGTTIERRLTWKRNAVPVDLTGWIARMEVRDKIGGLLLFRLDTSNGKLTLGGTAGTIDVRITATETSTWLFKAGVYDLELEDTNGKVGRLLQGKVKVNQQVTTGA